MAGGTERVRGEKRMKGRVGKWIKEGRVNGI